jgi:hypothetical protein
LHSIDSIDSIDSIGFLSVIAVFLFIIGLQPNGRYCHCNFFTEFEAWTKKYFFMLFKLVNVSFFSLSPLVEIALQSLQSELYKFVLVPRPSRGHEPFPAGAIVRREWPRCGILWGANRQFSNDRRIHNVATLIMPVICGFMCCSDPRSGAHQVRSQAHAFSQEVYGVGFVQRE